METLCWSIAVVIVFAIVLLSGIWCGVASERQLAIKADAANWVVNSKTGKVTFVYKTQKGV